MICPVCQDVFKTDEDLINHLITVEKWQREDFERLINIGILSRHEIEELLSPK